MQKPATSPERRNFRQGFDDRVGLDGVLVGAVIDGIGRRLTQMLAARH